ncbi:unnamed protein product [Blepharisma stoltei]|uniref:2-hydroxyacyl-CoA lyase n=1 Tax=Blepharisma stoltei TaxID=1481888 RepID=A0AAU9ITS2_9CILI|nr:unnamed protein product [Blepharisma stoltei]
MHLFYSKNNFIYCWLVEMLVIEGQQSEFKTLLLCILIYKMSTNLIVAKALQSQGVKKCYGIMGFPIIEMAMTFHQEGIQWIAFRNEQGAAYAAGIEGYLTQRPGICATVSGPGFTNALSGLANARDNSWPMILISGSSEVAQLGRDAFQEFDQAEAAREFVKWSIRVTCLEMIPRVIERAFRISMSGRPGPVYIDLPADILRATIPEEPAYLPYFNKLLGPMGNPECIKEAILLLKNAKNPLVIVGKGVAYARAETSVNELISNTGLPYLPTPMGKGIIPDSSEFCVSPARSTVLGNADIILLLGARLNWILHFGLPPRFNPNVKFIQINIDPHQLSNNVRDAVSIHADLSLAIPQLIAGLGNWKFASQEWWAKINASIKKNNQLSQDFTNAPEFNYYNSLNKVNEFIRKDAILVIEGSNTMDIARTVVPSYLPRARLDAGSFGTMGVAIPACIAAKAINPDKEIFAIVGDSSFGFSAMEIETATRFKLDMLIVIINNNGIAFGVDSLPEDPKEIRPNALNPATQYEKLTEALGGIGYRAKNLKELEEVMKKATATKGVRVVNVCIDPNAGKKPQQHFWLSMPDPKL